MGGLKLIARALHYKHTITLVALVFLLYYIRVDCKPVIALYEYIIQYIIEMSTGPGRMRAGPGRAGPGSGRI